LAESEALSCSAVNDLLKLLPQMLRHISDTDEAREQAAFAAWSASAGNQLRKVTVPIKLDCKTLTVAVLDSNWRSQLAQMSGQILFRVNSLLGTVMVTGIEFVVDEELVKRFQQSIRPTQAAHLLAAPEEQIMPLREKAEIIPDSALRETFLRAAGKCLARRAV
jgi:hypothetical protein